MAHWGLCSGCLLGVAAVIAAIVAMRWLDGAMAWVGWFFFALFAWGAVMSIYAFDRPAPLTRSPRPRKLSG